MGLGMGLDSDGAHLRPLIPLLLGRGDQCVDAVGGRREHETTLVASVSIVYPRRCSSSGDHAEVANGQVTDWGAK